jgi:hypothetical protein
MQWTYSETTECYTDDTYKEYSGAYGYTIIPYVEKWSLYFANGWRTTQPTGEYINQQAMNSNCYAIPSGGLPPELLFDSAEEAKFAAQMHKESGIDPEGDDFMLSCELCETKSPTVYIEDEVIDAAIDAGWTVEGNNEDTQDLCPKCQGDKDNKWRDGFSMGIDR